MWVVALLEASCDVTSNGRDLGFTKNEKSVEFAINVIFLCLTCKITNK